MKRNQKDYFYGLKQKMNLSLIKIVLYFEFISYQTVLKWITMNYNCKWTVLDFG